METQAIGPGPPRPAADISKKKMDEVELKLIEAALYTMADAVNALMRDGVPYTKMQIGGQ